MYPPHGDPSKATRPFVFVHWTGGQKPHFCREGIAKMFGWPIEKVCWPWNGTIFWKSKFTLGAVRATSSVLKYASLRVKPPKLATRLLGKSEM